MANRLPVIGGPADGQVIDIDSIGIEPCPCCGEMMVPTFYKNGESHRYAVTDVSVEYRGLVDG